jgi:hypothetical protein
VKDRVQQIFNVDHGARALLTMPTSQGIKCVFIDCGQAADYNDKPWYRGPTFGRSVSASWTFSSARCLTAKRWFGHR